MTEAIEHWTQNTRVGYIKEDSLALNTFNHNLLHDSNNFIIPDGAYMNNKTKSEKSSVEMSELAKEISGNSYIQNIIDNCQTKDSAENIFLSMLLTDGHVYEKDNNMEIVYKGLDRELHIIFAALMYKGYGILPNTFFRGYDENGTIVYRTISRNKELLKNLKKKCPHFRTSPRDYEPKQFLRLFKPTLASCLSESKENKKTILQLAMAAEGYISPSFDRNFRISVGFSCSHPSLLAEWKQLFHEFDINMNTKRDRRGWAGVIGLYISDIKDVRKFQKNLNFTPSIKITNTNAFWKGITKRELLQKSIQFHEFLNFKYQTEGIPLKNYAKDWKTIFSDFMHKEISICEKEKMNNIFSALEKTGRRINANKFLRVIEHVDTHNNLDNKTFRLITGLKGIYSWSRCRAALKYYYGQYYSENKIWRSYEVIIKEVNKCDTKN